MSGIAVLTRTVESSGKVCAHLVELIQTQFDGASHCGIGKQRGEEAKREERRLERWHQASDGIVDYEAVQCAAKSRFLYSRPDWDRRAVMRGEVVNQDTNI